MRQRTLCSKLAVALDPSVSTFVFQIQPDKADGNGGGGGIPERKGIGAHGEMDDGNLRPAYLCEVFARSRVDRGIGRVQEGTGRAGLARTLTEELAGDMLGIWMSTG